MLLKRVLAFLIDYLIVVAYAGLLFLVVYLLNPGIITQTEPFAESINPLRSQLIGFFTLTLPVFLYFFLTENNSRHATIGKRIFKIEIASYPASALTTRKIFIRNLLKFLPWEIAHTGVHWLVYYNQNGAETPVGVYIILTIPQLIMILYFFSIVFSRGHRSIYDSVAGTTVKKV